MDGKSNYPDRKDGKISLRAKKDRSQVIPNYCVIGTTITEIHPPPLHQSFGITTTILSYI